MASNAAPAGELEPGNGRTASAIRQPLAAGWILHDELCISLSPKETVGLRGTKRFETLRSAFVSYYEQEKVIRPLL